MSTQIERNAQMVADLAISDWRMAYVIACSVQSGTAGRPAKRITSTLAITKVPMAEFARLVKKAAGGKVYGVGEHGIASTLKRWDSLVTEGYVWDRDELTPGDANDEVEFPDWSFKSETTTGTADASNSRVIKANPSIVADALEDQAFAAKVMGQATPKAVKSTQKAANEAASTIPSEDWERMRNRHGKAEKHREGVHPFAAMDLMDLSKDLLTTARKVEKITLDNTTLDADAIEFTKVNVIETIGVLTGVVRALTGNADWDSAFAELSK